MKKTMNNEQLRDTYARYLGANGERYRNQLFESMVPTFEQITTGIYQTLKLSDNELQMELNQRIMIKIWEKMDYDLLNKAHSLLGFIRVMAMNTIRDYFKLEHIYSKHVKTIKTMIEKQMDMDTKFISNGYKASDHLIDLVINK